MAKADTKRNKKSDAKRHPSKDVTRDAKSERPHDGQAEAAALPDTREALLALHRAARHRRDAAPLESRERAAASEELARIEVHVARIERAMDPPLG
jgi:hypothetical protein